MPADLPFSSLVICSYVVALDSQIYLDSLKLKAEKAFAIRSKKLSNEKERVDLCMRWVEEASAAARDAAKRSVGSAAQRRAHSHAAQKCRQRRRWKERGQNLRRMDLLLEHSFAPIHDDPSLNAACRRRKGRNGCSERLKSWACSQITLASNSAATQIAIICAAGGS